MPPTTNSVVDEFSYSCRPIATQLSTNFNTDAKSAADKHTSNNLKKESNIMKIGDKVRFLSEVGGGIVVGFKNNNIALVEDEDGFQIPTQLSDLVVVNEDKQTKSLPGMPKTAAEPTQSVIEKTNKSHNADILDKVNDNVRLNVNERADGETINMLLAFVPQDRQNISKTKFHVYAINDCNYFLSYTYSLFDGKQWKLLSHNELEPNTKLLIAEVNIESVADYKNGAVQLIAYKVGKPFAMQPSMDVRLKVDPVKFYKLHTFRENDFFDEEALIIPVVADGKPAKELEINAADLTKKMMQKQTIEITAPARKPKQTQTSDGNNGPMVIDLHASEVLETTAGLSNAEILNYQLDIFRKTIEEFKAKKGMKIVFIHGKGEGVLRNAIIKELRYRYKSFTYQDASFQEYGYGATQVTIH